MANPKRKWSKARTSRHRSAWKLGVPGLVECPQCHTKMLRHKVCKTCGYLMARKLSRSKLRLNFRPDKTAFKNGSADLLQKDALLFCWLRFIIP